MARRARRQAVAAGRRPGLRRACLLGAVAAALLALVPQGASAQEEGPARPDVFKGAASATVLHVRFDRRTGGVLPLPDVFRFGLLQGSSTYESSDVAAEAAIFYPGTGVLSGPGLVCGTFGGSFPPEFAPVLEICGQYRYPLFVRADETAPDVSTDGSARVGNPGELLFANAASAVAHAAADSSSSDVATSDLSIRVLDLLEVIGIDAATSRTRQFLDEDGHLVVEGEAVLEGLTIGEGLLPTGLLAIDSITARSRSVDDPTDDGPGTSESSIVVEGASLAGMPVQITDQGLVLGSPGGAATPLLGPLGSLLTGLLSGLGVEARLVGAAQSVNEAGFTVGEATAVQLNVGLDLRALLLGAGVPDLADFYDLELLVATVGTRAFASDVSFDAPSPALPSTGGSPSSPGVSPASPGAPASTPSTPAAVVPPAAAPEEPALERVRDLLPGRIELLYLAFTLAALGLCLAPRASMPARLPSPGPRAGRSTP